MRVLLRAFPLTNRMELRDEYVDVVVGDYSL